MKTSLLILSSVALLCLACGPGPVTAEEDALTNSADQDLGFGTDQFFGNLTTSPNLVADADCPALGVSQGDWVRVFAQSTAFAIVRADDSFAVSIRVPSQGRYVFRGTRPSRIANEITSSSLKLHASMDPTSTDITVEATNTHASCLLRRCPAFGACQ